MMTKDDHQQVSTTITWTANCRPPLLSRLLFLLLLVLFPSLPLHHAQWALPPPHAHQQQQPMPLMAEPLINGHAIPHRAHLGCVLCIHCCCCCMCPPSSTPTRHIVAPEQPPLVPLSAQPTTATAGAATGPDGGGGGGSAQMQPFRQPFPSGAHFPFSATAQHSAQDGVGPFAVGSPTASFLSPSSMGPVQIGPPHQQQNGHQMALSEFASGVGEGEPGLLRNFQGDQYTNEQRIAETRQMNGPFFERIGGEPHYGGDGGMHRSEEQWKN